MIDFEPLYTTPTVEAVGRFLERHYALATPLRSVLLSRGLNDVYLIETENSESCIFRLSGLRARGAADVATETGFLAHLDRCGVAVAAAIPARTDALFVRGRAGEGMREAVLFRALKGRAPEPASAADARANGATLAAIHKPPRRFAPPRRAFGSTSIICCADRSRACSPAGSSRTKPGARGSKPWPPARAQPSKPQAISRGRIVMEIATASTPGSARTGKPPSSTSTTAVRAF